MLKYKDMPKEHFHLFLKGYEWLFIHSDLKRQLHKLKQWVEYKLNWSSNLG